MALVVTASANPVLFQGKTGTSIAYPFLFPTGTDTGVATSSSYTTLPYVTPSNFATHVPTATLTAITQAGFDHVRLEVNVGPLIECIKLGQTGAGSRFLTLIGQIKTAADSIIAANLSCILSFNLTGFVTGYDSLTFLDNPAGTSSTQFFNYLQMVTFTCAQF